MLTAVTSITGQVQEISEKMIQKKMFSDYLNVSYFVHDVLLFSASLNNLRHELLQNRKVSSSSKYIKVSFVSLG